MFLLESTGRNGAIRKSRGQNGHELLQVLKLHGKRILKNEREPSHHDRVILLESITHGHGMMVRHIMIVDGVWRK